MPRNISSVGIAALAGAVAALFCGGCEKESRVADREVLAKIQQSATADQAQAQRLLSEAASKQAAWWGNQAHAKAMLAQAKHRAAMERLSQVSAAAVPSGTAGDGEARADLPATLEVRAYRLLHEIGLLGDAIAANSRMAAAYSQNNPQEALAALEALKQDKTGRIAQIEQQMQQVAAAAAALEEQIRQFTEQRSTLADQAASLFDQADRAKGEAWLKLHNQALELRAAASKLTTQIEHGTIQLAAIKRQQALLEGQKKALEEAIRVADSQAAELRQSWEQYQAGMASRAADSRRVVEAGSADQKAMKARAEELQSVLGQIQAKRKEAAELLTEAATGFEAAAAAAGRVSSELQALISDARFSNSPLKDNWKALKQTYDPDRYRLSRARMLHELGNLHADEMAMREAIARVAARVVPALKQANLPVPEALATEPSAQESKELAERNLREAVSAYEDLTKSATLGSDEQTAVRTAWAFADYSLYRVTADRRHLTSARAMLDDILNKASPPTPLPLLPEDLEVRSVAMPTLPAPTTRPAPGGEGDTTAPAGGEGGGLTDPSRPGAPAPGGGEETPTPPEQGNPAPAPPGPPAEERDGRQAPTDQ